MDHSRVNMNSFYYDYEFPFSEQSEDGTRLFNNKFLPVNPRTYEPNFVENSSFVDELNQLTSTTNNIDHVSKLERHFSKCKITSNPNQTNEIKTEDLINEFELILKAKLANKSVLNAVNNKCKPTTHSIVKAKCKMPRIKPVVIPKQKHLDKNIIKTAESIYNMPLRVDNILTTVGQIIDDCPVVQTGSECKTFYPLPQTQTKNPFTLFTGLNEKSKYICVKYRRLERKTTGTTFNNALEGVPPKLEDPEYMLFEAPYIPEAQRLFHIGYVQNDQQSSQQDKNMPMFPLVRLNTLIPPRITKLSEHPSAGNRKEPQTIVVTIKTSSQLARGGV